MWLISRARKLVRKFEMRHETFHFAKLTKNVRCTFLQIFSIFCVTVCNVIITNGLANIIPHLSIYEDVVFI